MEIIIKSQENGWETERRMELPADDGLVKSILRSVKRRVNPPANAGEHRELKRVQPTELLAPENQITVTDVRTVFETGVRGFLLIRCAGCGKEYAINAREPIKSSTCRACGHVTLLEELAIAELRCPACGQTWHYRTNSEEPEIACRCVVCGAEMTGRWNGKMRRYLPRE